MASKVRKEGMKIVPPGKKKCIWMESGVVSYKLCDNNYDCPTCVYDQAMQAKVASRKDAIAAPFMEASTEGLPMTWVEKMMQLPAAQRKCRYMVTGEVDRKICPNAYGCGACSFDEMMQSRLQTEPLSVSSQTEVAGFGLAGDTYYHEGHTWAKPEYGGRVRVGLDDFAQRLLGRLTGITAPGIGQEVTQGQVAFQVRKDSKGARVLSPVDGIVSHVNPQILEHPDLVNESPYEKGWLFIVEPTRLRSNLKAMHYGNDADRFLGEEAEKLFSMAHEDQRIAADGGTPVEDILGELKGEDWSRFITAFLRT
jgi:glycine cleavage system H lipoate-binding protein